MAIMHLIQSYCKPLLLYACECFNITRSEISQLFNVVTSNLQYTRRSVTPRY